MNFQSFVTAMQDAVLNARNGLMSQNLDLLNQYFESELDADGRSVLKPISVIITYPRYASDGTATSVDVHVPLITLLPITMPTLEEVKFKTDMQLHLVDNEILVNFQGGGNPFTGSTTTATSTGVTTTGSTTTGTTTGTGNTTSTTTVSPTGGTGSGSTIFDNPPEVFFGEVEIVIKPNEGPAGLRILVEGLEKTLRSQIP